MTYYAALDVSLRTVSLCVIDDQGDIQAEAKLASEVEAIVAYLQWDDEIATPLDKLLGATITYRVAVGSQCGQAPH